VVQQITIDQLQANPLQPRGSIVSGSLDELVESIKRHGIIEPLVVAHTPAGFQIIAGERRWRAAKLAGLTNVPAVIKETTPRGMLEMALVENVQRVDLNPIDRAKAFERLLVEFNLSNNEISERIGKSPAYVSNTLRLLKLPDALKDGLLSGVISEGHARALAAIDDTRLMIEAYKMILKESGSVRRAEDLARRMKHQAGQKSKTISFQPNLILTEELDKMQEDIKNFLGDGAGVVLKQSRVETRIFITLKGSPDKIEPALAKIRRRLSADSN